MYFHFLPLRLKWKCYHFNVTVRCLLIKVVQSKNNGDYRAVVNPMAIAAVAIPTCNFLHWFLHFTLIDPRNTKHAILLDVVRSRDASGHSSCILPIDCNLHKSVEVFLDFICRITKNHNSMFVLSNNSYLL